MTLKHVEVESRGSGSRPQRRGENEAALSAMPSLSKGRTSKMDRREPQSGSSSNTPRQRAQKVRDLASYSGEFVTVSELAGYWHVNARTIYRHILKGALSTVRIGPFARVRIRTRDALNYGRPSG